MPDARKFQVALEFVRQGDPAQLEADVARLTAALERLKTTQAQLNAQSGPSGGGASSGGPQKALDQSSVNVLHEITQATYNVGMGAYYANVPMLNFMSTTGNLLNGLGMMTEGVGQLATKLPLAAVGFLGATAGVVAFGMAIDASIKSTNEMIQRVSTLGTVMAANAADTSRMINQYATLYGPGGSAAALAGVSAAQVGTQGINIVQQTNAEAARRRSGDPNYYNPVLPDPYAQFGLSLLQPGSSMANPKFKPPDQAMFEAAQLLASMTDPSKSAIARSNFLPLFGGDSQREGFLTRTIEGGRRPGVSNQISDEATRVALAKSGQLAPTSSKALTDAEDQLTRANNDLANSFDRLKVSIGGPFLSIIAGAEEGLANLLSVFTGHKDTLDNMDRNKGGGGAGGGIGGGMYGGMAEGMRNATSAALPFKDAMTGLDGVMKALVPSIIESADPAKHLGDNLNFFSSAWKNADFPRMAAEAKLWGDAVSGAFIKVGVAKEDLMAKLAQPFAKQQIEIDVLINVTWVETVIEQFLMQTTQSLERTITITTTWTDPQVEVLITVPEAILTRMIQVTALWLTEGEQWIGGLLPLIERNVVVNTLWLTEAEMWVSGQLAMIERMMTITILWGAAEVQQWIAGALAQIERTIAIIWSFLTDEITGWITGKSPLNRQVNVAMNVTNPGALTNAMGDAYNPATMGGLPPAIPIKPGGLAPPVTMPGVPDVTAPGIFIPGFGVVPMPGFGAAGAGAPGAPGGPPGGGNLPDWLQKLIDSITNAVKPVGGPGDQPPDLTMGTMIGPTTGGGQAYRGSQWAAQIAAASVKTGVNPDVIWAVMQQESGGNPNARGSSGEIGLMQLMPGLASSLGVNANDPGQNIMGGAAYLKDQLDRFGQLNLALAAYNAGPGAVTAAGGVPAFQSTQQYVQAIMANLQQAGDTFQTTLGSGGTASTAITETTTGIQTLGAQSDRMLGAAGKLPVNSKITDTLLQALSQTTKGQLSPAMLEAMASSGLVNTKFGDVSTTTTTRLNPAILLAIASADITNTSLGNVHTTASTRLTPSIIALTLKAFALGEQDGFLHARDASDVTKGSFDKLNGMLPGMTANVQALRDMINSMTDKTVTITTVHNDVYTSSGGGGGAPNPFDAGSPPGSIPAGPAPFATALGGYFTRPTNILVGEAGPEWVIPANRMPTISDIGGMNRGGGTTINFNISANGMDFSDPAATQRMARVLGDQIMANVRTIVSTGRII